MASKEFWSTRSLKRSTFHLLLSGSKRFEIKKGESWLFGPLGLSLNPSNHNTQGSFHMSIAVLSPTMKHAHLQIRPYNFSITLQRGDAFLISSLPNQSPWNLYLLCKARTHRLSLPETTHQVNLASSAWLKPLDLLNFKPPLFFGWQSESQKHQPRKSPFSFSRAPQESLDGRIKLITHNNGNILSGERVGRQCLGNQLYQNLPTSLGQGFALPPFKFWVKSVNQVLEVFGLAIWRENGGTRIKRIKFQFPHLHLSLHPNVLCHCGPL